VDIITPDNRNEQVAEEKAKQVQMFIDNYKANELPRLEQELEPLRQQKQQQHHLTRYEKPGHLIQTLYLFFRQVTNTRRNLQFLCIRAFTYLLMATVMGFTVLQIHNDQSSVNDRNGFLFFSVVFLSFNEMNSVITTCMY
jgi:predicted ribosome quality control (RQC) complex YloA/Tae2 family protein